MGRLSARWDRERINRWFKHRADMARLYVESRKQQAVDQPSYQPLIDEHSALWAVNDYFVDRSFTESKAALLRELHRLRSTEPPTWHGVYERRRFEAHWRGAIDELIEVYSR